MDYFAYRSSSSSSSSSSYCHSDGSDSDEAGSSHPNSWKGETSSNLTSTATTTTSGVNLTSTGSLPPTPTAYPQDIDRSADRNSRPAHMRYSASFFIPDHGEPFNLISLSQSLPSPPITPQTTERRQQQEAEPQTLKKPSLSRYPFQSQASSANFLPPSLSVPSSLGDSSCADHVQDTLRDRNEDDDNIIQRRFSHPPMTRHLPRLHILLVDDNSINLAILSKLLKIHLSQYIEHIELVKSGIKALEVLKCRPFDLILMDIDMPLMNGVETTKHIRCSFEFDVLPRNRKAPIFAVTTNDSEAWRQLYKDIGMNGCISKPISPIDLIKSLCSAFDLPMSMPPYTPQ
ncbi:CheY-like superfamily [Mycotypha africana]|uniref:CheY-like superfamily n=1 Tax=Mycotypha africana TaxID=64632 RepID=UPI0023004C3D|nr:CheY-like superfamily [Mycotypha africana]KAI8990996.1 CheY-like superfamily [Mycotypha africana]